MTKLWKRWTINCTVGELLGIAAAGGIAYAVNSIFVDQSDIFSKICVLSAMIFAGFIEGTILSFFQWKVLVTKFGDVPKSEWMYYTVLIAMIGWFLGMLPSLFFMPTNSELMTSTEEIDFSNPFLFVILSIGSGLILGAMFGLFQWFSLRKYARKAYLWIIANALGWGLGLGWIYLFASLPSEDSSLFFNVMMGIMGGILAGLSVGGVTGIYLVKLEKKRITL